MARRKSRNATYVAALRTLCWTVVWAAVWMALTQPVLGPGGAQLGLALAGLLAVALHATRNTPRRRRASRNPKGRKS